MKLWRRYLTKPFSVLILISLLGLGFRTLGLPSNPPPNRDELAIGYNAYSVLLTGFDEHGRGPWPINFQSFGDYKLPGLIYLAIPFIHVLGFSLWVIRLPTVILGTLLIPLTFVLVKKLLHSPKLALWAALFLAIAPWHIHSSRSVYEPLAALTLHVLALVLLLKMRPPWLAICTYFGVAIISMFVYNSFLILFLPILLLVKLVLRKNLFAFKPLTLVLLGGLAIIPLLTVYTALRHNNVSRFATTIFSQPEVELQLARERADITRQGIPLPLTKLLVNRPMLIAAKFTGSYLSAFNPSYLFATDQNSWWHNLAAIRFGEFQAYDLVFLAVTGYSFLMNPTVAGAGLTFLLVFLAIAPLPNAITIDTPNTNRLLDFHYIITLLSTWGFYRLWQNSHHFLRLRALIVLSVAISFGYFIVLYQSLFPKTDSHLWQSEASGLIRTVVPYESRYAHIIINDLSLGYIYMAFYRPLDPREFQLKAEWVNNGFDEVKNFDKYEFNSGPNQRIYINNLLNHTADGGDTLVVMKAEQRQRPQEPVFVYRNRWGEPLWEAYAIPPVPTEAQLQRN